MKILGNLFKILFFSILAGIIIAIIWLQTNSANNLIRNILTDATYDNLGYVLKINNMRISLPLVIDIDSANITDNEVQIASITDLHINILPALDSFWNITFWSISAKELSLDNIPQIKIDNNKENEQKKGFFNPNIIIRDINIDSIKLSPAITGRSEPFLLSLNSSLEYNNSEEQLSVSTYGKILSLNQAAFEIIGSYNNKSHKIDLKLAKIKSPDVKAKIKLVVDHENDIIDGLITYKSNTLEQLLGTQTSNTKIGIAHGDIKISGSPTSPRVTAKGDVEIDAKELKYDADFLSHLEHGEGVLNVSYDKINAGGDILYKDRKISLPQFIIKGEDFEETNNLTLDIDSHIITGEASFTDKNLLLIAKYFPSLNNGLVSVKAIFSSADNIKQQLSIIGKVSNLKGEGFNLGNFDINFYSSDLWQKKLNDLSCQFKSINVEGYEIDEVKINAGMQSNYMNIDGRIISKNIIPLNLKFNAALKAQDEENNISISKPIDLSINTLEGIIGFAKIKNTSKITLLFDEQTNIKMDKLKIDQGTLSVNAVIDSLSTNIDASLKEFPLKPLINLIGHKITGLLTGDVNVQIKDGATYLDGDVKLKSGKYYYKSYGVQLKDISSNLKLNGMQIKFNNISAADNFGNNLKGDGNIDFANGFDYKFKFNTPKFSPVNTPFMYGEVKGNIAVNGNKNQASASGDLILGPFEIKIPEHFSHDIPQLNTIEDEEEEIEKSVYPFKLDIALKTTDDVYIRGMGVDTRLGGNLKISGDIDDPVVKGILSTNHGKYQEFGKVLTIKRGELIFDGNIPPSPFLNIIGVYNNGDTQIRVILSGSIQKPKISLESTPAMRKDNILSILLFGVTPEHISTFQTLQLANSVRRLSGHGGIGIDPFSFGRKILKVDDINFKNDEENPENTSIGIGKHLTEKIYLEVEGGRHDNNKVRIEVRVSPKISIENVTKQAGSTSLGVNWRFDY